MSADDRSGGIIVAGDVTIDWNLTRSAVGERDVWQWNAEDETHVYRQVGGASLLADVLEEVVADVGQARPVFRHISRPPNDASPADFAFPQSWAIWSLFPYEIGKYQGGAKTAWRVQEFLGLDRRVHRELCPPVPNVDGEDEPPFIVVLDDAALGFRDDRQVWPAALLSTDSRENLPAWILLKMAKPIAQGPLWEHLVTHFADRLIVTLAINDLRLMNVQVNRDVSWERTAEDLAWELLNNPLVNSLSQCGTRCGFLLYGRCISTFGWAWETKDGKYRSQGRAAVRSFAR